MRGQRSRRYFWWLFTLALVLSIVFAGRGRSSPRQPRAARVAAFTTFVVAGGALLWMERELRRRREEEEAEEVLREAFEADDRASRPR